MVERLGHVKNPLTVIAIFAALAEVSGTVVLPLLDVRTQAIYVWFLMLFPIFLVASFFYVLYKKHHVMYAPTDFKNDETFKELFERSSGAAKVEKIVSETEAPLVEPTGEVPSESASIPDAIEGVSSISAEETLRRSFQGNSLLAEELVIAKLSKQMNIKFERNLVVKGVSPKLVFDAVGTYKDKPVVVEVRFTRSGFIPADIRSQYFENIKLFSAELSEEQRESLRFVFVVVTDLDDEERLAVIRRTVDRMRALAQDYSFKTGVFLFKMKDLENEFKVH